MQPALEAQGLQSSPIPELLLQSTGIAAAADATDAPLVLLLSPLKDAAAHVGRLLEHIRQLDYPLHRVSVGFLDSDSRDEPSAAAAQRVAELAAAGELGNFRLQPQHSQRAARESMAARSLRGRADDSSDDDSWRRWRHTGTLYAVLSRVPELQSAGIRRISVLQRDFGLALPRDRHAQGFQLARRSVLARSRNYLLSSALRDEEWVLWVDSDVAAVPRSLLAALLSARRDIVAPNVVMAPGDRSYDLNSWRATRPLQRRTAAGAAELPAPGDDAAVEAVRAYHDALHDAELAAGRDGWGLHLEGYGNEQRHAYLSDMRGHCAAAEGAGNGELLRKQPQLQLEPPPSPPPCVVRLDGVGGAVLLVRAELHRQGLIFPPFVHRHRIETEGLSTVALDMGVLSYGMPLVEVLHH